MYLKNCTNKNFSTLLFSMIYYTLVHATNIYCVCYTYHRYWGRAQAVNRWTVRATKTTRLLSSLPKTYMQIIHLSEAGQRQCNLKVENLHMESNSPILKLWFWPSTTSMAPGKSLNSLSYPFHNWKWGLHHQIHGVLGRI